MKCYNFKYLIILVTFSLISTYAFSTQLSIPNQLIALNSLKGIQLFNETSDKKDFWSLSNYFVTENNQAFCGVASLVMILNASEITRPIEKPFAPYGFFTQENFFNNAKVSKIIPMTLVEKQGITLDQLKRIGLTFSLNVKAIHASSQINNLKSFRLIAKRALGSSTQFIIVNFYRPILGEIGAGHFSPLAAYDAKTDRFLLMDVARYKYPPVWVKTKTLWKAMGTLDSTSKQNRGYLVISAR